ncbi:hypothetical protein CKO28_02675 [Rhodovibrio sodomensis]|uniref:MobA/MobL protein domain-containing protein n=1 Tax=Rhodovibrio sodomensis TaxID=1088 RepID=A0ABS1DA07_9PROT|nr:MobA/MobL family protein [Rhodovibrio sodomensis]MBK1666947.1 hypothetical protein [Rhodovibrio sodomensis]
MLQEQLDRLGQLQREVDQAVQRTAERRSASRGLRQALLARGRYARRPTYAAPAIQSSRPTSDRGQTFHFAHTFISKRNSQAVGYRDQTSAAAHQSYMERPGVAELAESEVGERHVVSFGNLGETKNERAEFWRKVEQSEGRKARVQCRLILELPHELDTAGRERIIRDFCQEFEDRSFPYWAVVHAPSKHNDRRNYHCHIAYFDRPARRMEDNRWDFEITEEKRWANRKVATVRPHKQPKLPDASGPKWIRALRASFAQAANREFERAGVTRRYDPRSYRESGISKQPTRHLGNKIAYAESLGIDTKLGRVNAEREMDYQLSAGTLRYVEDAARMERILDTRGTGDAPEDAFSDDLVQLCQRYRDLSAQAAKFEKRRAVHALASDAVGRRLDVRLNFLSDEADRLITNPPRGDDAAALDIASALFEEKLLVMSAHSDVAPFRERCTEISHTAADRVRALGEGRRQTLLQISGIAPWIATEIGPVQADTAVQKDADPQPIGIIDLGDDILDDAAVDQAIASRRGQTNAEELPTAAPDLGHTEALEELFAELEDGAGSDPVTEPRPHAPDRAAHHSGTIPADDRIADSGNRTDEPAATREEWIEDPAPSSDRHADPFPGALSLRTPASTEEIAELEGRLSGYTNAELRYAAFATRDASELHEDGRAAARHGAALRVVVDLADRRGLDLETGRHDPAIARDPALARQHTDQAGDDVVARLRQMQQRRHRAR